MSQLIDNQWTDRVDQLRQDTSEVFACWQGEFSLNDDFEEFLRTGFRGQEFTSAEQRLIRNELARILTRGDWYPMLRALHGGDNRRLDVHGLTIAALAAAIPAGPASVKRWLAGTAVPNLAAQAAIERLYNEQRGSK